MTRGRGQRESGQTLIEFSFIAVAILILTVGIADVGPAFFQYNALASGARFGARWGSVVAGVCGFEGRTPAPGESTWCSQYGGSLSAYWSQPGNTPLQGVNVPCPNDFTNDMQSDPNRADFYSDAPGAGASLSTFASPSATTIVGAILTHFDTSASSNNVVEGIVSPGFRWDKLRICLEERQDSTSPSPRMSPGARIRVVVYYPYTLISGGLLGTAGFHLVAASEYQVD